MTKAIYSMKMEILFDGNEDVLRLSARERQSNEDTLRINRFIVKMYI